MLHRLWAAEDLAGLGQPGVSLFGEAAGYVFGVASFQRCLLGQLQRLDGGERAAVDTLEAGGEFAAAGFDGGPAGRPAGVQSGVDADDFSDRPQPQVRVGTFGEPDPEACPEVVFQCGVVGFRRRHRGLKQDPSVDGQPASVEGLHFVGDRDMGVQVRVAGATVPVGERGRHQAPHLNLPDPVGA